MFGFFFGLLRGRIRTHDMRTRTSTRAQTAAWYMSRPCSMMHLEHLSIARVLQRERRLEMTYGGYSTQDHEEGVVGQENLQ